jgi:hypothetical protein
MFCRLCCTVSAHKNHCEDSQYNGYDSLFKIKEDKIDNAKKSKFSLQKGYCNDVDGQIKRQNKDKGNKKNK